MFFDDVLAICQPSPAPSPIIPGKVMSIPSYAKRPSHMASKGHHVPVPWVRPRHSLLVLCLVNLHTSRCPIIFITCPIRRRNSHTLIVAFGSCRVLDNASGNIRKFSFSEYLTGRSAIVCIFYSESFHKCKEIREVFESVGNELKQRMMRCIKIDILLF